MRTTTKLPDLTTARKRRITADHATSNLQNSCNLTKIVRSESGPENPQFLLLTAGSGLARVQVHVKSTI